MSPWQLAINSFRHYLKSNLALILGVAAATAVLTGALLVGESMRKSLRKLALDRLGNVDELLISQGFFDATQFQPENTQASSPDYELSVPAILFNNGTVELSSGDKTSRATNVNVFGVPPEFWQLDTQPNQPTSDSPGSPTQPTGQTALINRALADLLGPTDSADLTLRIPKPTQLPSESALGANSDLIESIVGIRISNVLPNKGLAGFNLHPSQRDTPNIFVPLEMLQDALSRKALRHKSNANQANVVFLQHRNKLDRRPQPLASSKSLEDEGLILNRVTSGFDGQKTYDYWSISSEQMVLRPQVVKAIEKSFPVPAIKPVFTYLANDIRLSDQESGIPFSMITAIDFDDAFPLRDSFGQAIEPLTENQIVLNSWAADNIGARVDDTITVTWFAPETTHGQQTENSASFEVAAITELTQPTSTFRVRRGTVTPPTFDKQPRLANDWNLTPTVPGVTDAQSIDQWDLPFETADRIRPDDDDYWGLYRTTPKAFISLAAGQKLFGSRFGNVTSFRIAATGDNDKRRIEDRVLSNIATIPGASNFDVVKVREKILAASSGSTPFDVLFLALSMFVIASALILVSLLFRLALQSRANEVGLLAAVGLSQKQVFRVWVLEMALVSIAGAVFGALLGIGYAALMILGLKTWWLGAISKPIIDLHVGPISIVAGVLGGVLVCIGTIAWALRGIRKLPTRGLLAGHVADSPSATRTRHRWLTPVSLVLLVVAVVLATVAISLYGDAQAGAFMGSGFCVLTAILMLVFRYLNRPRTEGQIGDLREMASTTLSRNPLRSTLTIGLVAVASFLIVAVSAFRLSPTEKGTAGFDFVATSSQPIVADLNSADGQSDLLGDGNRLGDQVSVFSFRLKPGEDASCNNLYQSTQPRVLGVPQEFIDRFDVDTQPTFAWGGGIADTDVEKANPWKLLRRKYDDGAIPVIIDKNTANYSLKIFAPGGDYVVKFDSGEEVTFRVVGFLSNTILQGSLLVSGEEFTRAFPHLGGYRYFLVDGGDGDSSRDIATLESQLGDEGFDARPAEGLLAGFMSVQNSYLSTFQALGALGLLLGTLGLAAVQIRNVFERQQELGLMRAVGFGKSRIRSLIFGENLWLLGMGLATGIVSALCCTIPHFLFGSASVPWTSLAVMFAIIIAIGLIASLWATRIINRMNLLQSLRD